MKLLFYLYRDADNYKAIGCAQFLEDERETRQHTEQFNELLEDGCFVVKAGLPHPGEKWSDFFNDETDHYMAELIGLVSTEHPDHDLYAEGVERHQLLQDNQPALQADVTKDMGVTFSRWLAEYKRVLESSAVSEFGREE